MNEIIVKINISELEECDRPQLRLLYKDVRQAAFTWIDIASFNLSDFDKDTEGEFVLVAKLEEEIVGFISIWPDDNFVHHLFIKNNYQRMGIGTRLLYLISKSTTSVMKLKCLKENEIGVNFYLKRGWRAKAEGISDHGEYILFEYPTKILTP